MPTKMTLIERIRANGGGVVPRQGDVGVAFGGWSKEGVGKRGVSFPSEVVANREWG